MRSFPTMPFAVFGALLAIEKELDYYGIVFFAIITSVGGGIVRDILINRRLPAALDNPLYIIIITLAVLTGTGGGILRDVFAREIPFVFRKEIYAMASVLGAILYYLIYKFMPGESALYVCFIVTSAIRLYCIQKDIHLRKVMKN